MKAKIYELYIDKFAGTLSGLTSRLDYFTHLGINTLHLLPHYPSPMVDDGYDISDFRGVRKELGTVDDFIECVRTAHEKGINVIVDMVLNHVSDQHPWFIEARASRDNPKRDYFVWSETGGELRGAPNPFIDFKESNWIWNEVTKDYYYATFYPQQPDLNWENPRVLEEMLTIFDLWVERGIDGFRLDAIPHLIEKEGTSSLGLPETHAIIKKIRAHLDSTHSGRILLLAEAVMQPHGAHMYFGDGDECQMVYHFALTEQLFVATLFGDVSGLKRITQDEWNLPAGCAWGIFLRNHDNVVLGWDSTEQRDRLLSRLDPEGLYGFSKSTSTSVRLGTVFAEQQEKLLEAFQLMYSLPGVPIMYYGDEIGMKNLPHDVSVTDSRRYVRGPFDWSIADSMLKDKNSLLYKVAAIIRHHD